MPNDYFTKVLDLVNALERRQTPQIEKAATAITRSLADGGIMHVFGSGHSLLPAVEAYARAGGLAPVDLLFDPGLSPISPAHTSAVERLHGYAQVPLSLADLRESGVMIVISNSGINPVPVEIALGAQDRGLTVVAVTSVAHSTAVTPRHDGEKRLCDVANIVIDTGAPTGDTTIDVSGFATGAVSTVLACVAMHALTVRTVELLARQRSNIPVLVSQNVDGDNDNYNRRIRAPYANRLTRA